jgi:hypothetical protein
MTSTVTRLAAICSICILAARGRSAETGSQLVLSPLEVTPIFENRRSSTAWQKC